MTEMSKVTEAKSSKVEPEQVEAPPSYSPRAMSPQPVTPLHPPPTTPVPSDVESAREPLLYAPRPPRLDDLTQIGADSAHVVCPRCHYSVQTKTTSRAGTHAGVWSLIACFTCGIVAAIIPLVIPSCQDVEHTCPHCNFVMARYRRGVNAAKVYPVNGDYIPVNQEDSPVAPLPKFPQQTGVADGKN